MQVTVSVTTFENHIKSSSLVIDFGKSVTDGVLLAESKVK